MSNRSKQDMSEIVQWCPACILEQMKWCEKRKRWDCPHCGSCLYPATDCDQDDKPKPARNTLGEIRADRPDIVKKVAEWRDGCGIPFPLWEFDLLDYIEQLEGLLAEAYERESDSS